MNPEIVEFFSGPKLWTEPTWVPPATWPSLGGIFRILIFRKYLRVGAAHAMVLRPQLMQPFLKLGLFRHEFTA
jgi:hypothetical protein